jgi:hypothetical protein
LVGVEPHVGGRAEDRVREAGVDDAPVAGRPTGYGS